MMEAPWVTKHFGFLFMLAICLICRERVLLEFLPVKGVEKVARLRK